MRIAFLVASPSEVGDGIGDYTELLAKHCIKKGHEVERYFIGKCTTIASQKLLAQKFEEIKQRLIAFRPDVISWQYDGNIFSPRRIFPVALVPDFSRIAKVTHLMIHETWEFGNLRRNFKGMLQKICLYRACKKINPDLVNVAVELYRRQVVSIGINAEILPMIATIPARPYVASEEKKDTLDFIFFGGIHPPWAHELLMAKVSKTNKNLVFHHVGRLSNNEEWLQLIKTYGHLGKFTKHGQMSPFEISRLLSQSDYAISTYPLFILKKSTIYWAYVEHGLPIIHCSPHRSDPADLSEYQQLISLSKLPSNLDSPQKADPINTLEISGEAFLKSVSCIIS